MSHDKWNPWHGCHKCSAGCQNCYMYALDSMRGLEKSKSNTVTKTNNFDYPLKQNRHKQYKIQSGERIMVNMTSDTFIEEADVWRDDFWKIIKQRSDVIFWLLTKRPERIMQCLPSDWNDGYENVALNITCENQEMFDKRINYLLQVPAKHKGICIAPCLGPVDLTTALTSGQIQEVCLGGENYDNPRPCYYDWVKFISDQCRAYKTNFCFYESGTKFILDGHQYFIPRKADQSATAYFSDLSCKFYDLHYNLVDENGNAIPEEKLYKKHYNLRHCAFCANRMMCNGCSNCGNCCCGVELGTLDQLYEREKELYEQITRPVQT